MGNRDFVSFVSIFAIIGLVTVASRPYRNTTLSKVDKIDGGIGGASRLAKPVIINKEDSPRISRTFYFCEYNQ